MPGPLIADPTPDWLKPQNASVTDSALTKAMRMMAHVIGADNPSAQVFNWMTTELPVEGEVLGGLGKAMAGLKAKALQRFPQFAGELKAPPVPAWGPVGANPAPLEEASHLPYAPAALSERGHLIVSTRVPTAVGRLAAPDQTPLVTDLSTVRLAPEAMQKMADRLRRSPILTHAEAQGDAPEVLDRFANRVKDNLLWLWDKTPADVRDLSKLWYEGAHARSLEDAAAFRVKPQQSSASIAILSPQKDWFQNAELARRLGSTWREFTDVNPTFTKDVFDQYRTQIFAGKEVALQKMTNAERSSAMQLLEDQLKAERRMYEGKAFADLPPAGRARMLRAFSEGTMPTDYPMLLPTGGVGDIVRNQAKKAGELGAPAKLGWGLPNKFIENAISVLENGSPENISDKLGAEHKVRSFFNNISDPWYPHAVTIDTHAVAAGHVSPFSQVAPEVNYVMSGPGNAFHGISGANPVYAEAYKRAAQERGVLPREMQSVTWESLRGLFSPAQKRDPAFVSAIRELWNAHQSGKMSLDQTYDAIHTAAGGITPPAWVAHYTK